MLATADGTVRAASLPLMSPERDYLNIGNELMYV